MIKSDSESHIVELDDGSRWQIFPGDLGLTLNWKPETELTVAPSDNDIGSHMLVGGVAQVHVIAAGESWPVNEVNSRRRLPRAITAEARPQKCSFPSASASERRFPADG